MRTSSLPPRYSLRTWHGGRKTHSVIHYTDNEHATFPHVVKFSGGRTSGLMLLSLLENNILSAERGDIVLFTNTSAEHPATMDFVRKMKKRTDTAGIPFFIAEFQTIETVVNGKWARRPNYRLVTENPYHLTKEPNGYRFKGEVFEEAVLWSAMLPSVFTRVCTTQMKMKVTYLFLADYLGGLLRTPKLGHTREKSLVNIKDMYLEHQTNGGTMSKKDYWRRWEAFSKLPFNRPSQDFAQYSKAATKYIEKLSSSPIGGLRASLKGEYAKDFLTFLGFRAGEDARYARMVARNNGRETPGHNDHPPGEFSYAPLYEMGYDQDKVFKFWRQQKADIRPRLPENINLSNCVYCFLKGGKKLAELDAHKAAFEKTLPKRLRKECADDNTPNRLEWWERLEGNHARGSRKKNGTSSGSFGMFGLNGKRYTDIRKESEKIGKSSNGNGKSGKSSSLELDAGISCECTD